MAAIEDRDPEFENEHEDADDEPQTVRRIHAGAGVCRFAC